MHHNPTKGGEDEQNKYIGMYNYTLLLYEKVLGAKPGAKYWPSAERRFSGGGLYTQAWLDEIGRAHV